MGSMKKAKGKILKKTKKVIPKKKISEMSASERAAAREAKIKSNVPQKLRDIHYAFIFAYLNNGYSIGKACKEVKLSEPRAHEVLKSSFAKKVINDHFSKVKEETEFDYIKVRSLALKRIIERLEAKDGVIYKHDKDGNPLPSAHVSKTVRITKGERGDCVETVYRE